MPARRAPRASQDSRVSCQPRGPDSSQSMSRANSIAGTADFSLNSEGLFGFSYIGRSIMRGMTNADDRSYRTERLGKVLRRVAGKLTAQRNLDQGSAAEDRREPRMRESAAPACVGQDRDGVVTSPSGGNAVCVRAGKGARLIAGDDDQTRGATPRQGGVGDGRSAFSDFAGGVCGARRPDCRLLAPLVGGPAVSHVSPSSAPNSRSTWSAAALSAGLTSIQCGARRHACMQVVWSRPPNRLPMAGSDR
jgi:hypothetical protein